MLKRHELASRVLIAIVLAAPALLTAWLVLRFGVDLPIIDQWSLPYDIDRHLTGTWTWNDLVRAHNGHRLVLPRLLWVHAAALTSWDVRVEMALNLLVAAGTFLLYLAVLRPVFPALTRPAAVLLAALVSTTHFSHNQFENWLWGFQLGTFLVTASSLAGLAVLSSDRPPLVRWLVAGLCGLVATTSHASGIAFWWLAAGATLVDPRSTLVRRWLRGTAWLGVALLVTVLYVQPRPGDVNPSMLGDRSAKTYALFFLSWLGAPFVSWSGAAWPPHDRGLAWIVGLLALGVWAGEGWAAVRRGARAPSTWRLQLLAFGGFSIAAAAMASLGRGAAGTTAAFASRYLTMSSPLVIAVAALLAHRFERAGGGRPGEWRLRLRPAWPSAVLVALLLSGIVGCYGGLHHYPARLIDFEKARRALLAGGPEAFLGLAHPHVRQVLRGRPLLEKHRLSVFDPRRGVPVTLARPVALGEFDQELSWLDSPPAALIAGALYRMPVRVANPSPVPWPTLGQELTQNGAVRLSYRWLGRGPSDRIEGERTDFRWDIAPGRGADLGLCVETPRAAGRYTLRVSLVQEGVAWFDDRGAPGLTAPVEVRPSVARLLVILGYRLKTLGGAIDCN